MKRQRENTNHISEKGSYLEYINNSQNSTVRKPPHEKRAKSFNRYFSKQNLQKAKGT